MTRSLRFATVATAASLLACGTAPNATPCNQTSDCTGDAVCAQNLCQQGFRLSMAPTGDGAGRITSAPDAFNCSAACSAPLAAGTNVTLHAIPDSNSDFLGWSGGCSGTGDCPVTMDSAKSVTALFRSNHVVFASEMKLDGTDAANVNTTLNVWRVNANGNGLLALTRTSASGANNISPRSSQDGRQVAFLSGRALDGTDAANGASSTLNVWRINADGTGLLALTRATASGDALLSMSPAQWSTDGKKLVFASSRNVDGSDTANANAVTNIWVVNTDGTGLTALTKATAAGASSTAPQWSPSGAQIAFSSSLKLDGTNASNATPNIWVMNADGTQLTPLTRASVASAGSFNPQWSADGTKLIFSSSRNINLTDTANTNSTQNVWLVNVDGGGLAPLTSNTVAAADSTFPRFALDGTSIVFVSAMRLDGSNAANTNNTSNVWRIGLDGRNLTALTRATASTDTGLMFPSFSLEGSRIIFTSSAKLDGTDAANPNSTLNIWRFNVNGGARTPLTRTTATNANSLTCSTAGGVELWLLPIAIVMGLKMRRRRWR